MQSAQLLEKFSTVQAVQAFWSEAARGKIMYTFENKASILSFKIMQPFFYIYY